MSAIFQKGSRIEESHYTSICREGMFNSWMEADDIQIKKRQCPRGAKDIYIFFLKQVASK